MHPRLLAPSLLLLVGTGLSGADQARPAKEVTPATIAKLVDQAQKEKPDWWDTVQLNYPQTLDLTCPKGGGWNAQVKPGQWMWDVVNPNQSHWKEATKFWHFCLANAKQKQLPDAEAMSIDELAHCYGNLLHDWPRALYWYQQADAKSGPNEERTIQEANAQWHLGSRTMALQTVKQLGADGTRNGNLIKLYADLGDYETAYRLAKQRIPQTEDVGWYMSGYTAQLQGDWAKALDCYKHAEAAQQKDSGRDWKQTRDRATAAIGAITLFETLDLKKVADGTYKDSSIGYTGPVGVAVTVADHQITAVTVTDHHEKQYYSSIEETPAKIIAKQHVKGVDATLGATITSEAIVYATAKALRQGQR